MFRIDDMDVVDATMQGNAARFINHCCEVRNNVSAFFLKDETKNIFKKIATFNVKYRS